MTMKFGVPILTDSLDDLEIGKSTHADVLLTLGQPRGRGAAYLSQDPRLREILLYEFVASDMSNVELEILTVLMVDDVFDGYLWFASSERIRSEGGGFLFPPDKVVQGYFPDIKPLEAVFVRGETSRTDVLDKLGVPTGIGAARMPQRYEIQDVLFYEDIQGGDLESGADGIVINMEQRILLVMLTNDVFDGFMWYSNVGIAEMK